MHNKNLTLHFLHLSVKKIRPYAFTAAFVAILYLVAFSTETVNASDAPILIENAIEGQTYIETITILNPEERENRIMVSSGGGISQWIEFYNNPDSIAPLAFATLQAKSTGIITAKITIPEGTPGGDYNGSIITAIASEDITGIIFPKTVQEVSIHVGSKKIIAFDAFITPKNSIIREGDILAIKALYKNRSNVRISPSLEVRIEKDNRTAYHAIFPYPENRPEIVPNLTFEIPAIEIPMENLKPGEYKVLLKAWEGDRNGYSSDEEFNFKIIESKNKEHFGNTSDLAGIKDIFSIHDNPPPLAISVPTAIGIYAMLIASKKLFFKLKVKLKNTLLRLRERKTKDD